MKILIKYIVVIVLMILTPLVYGQSFNKVVIFGDSMSDNGNVYKKFFKLMPRSPYYNGRFSNGYIWTDYFEDQLPGISVENNAYGGARTNGTFPVAGLIPQVSSYLTTHRNVNKDTLYIIFIGANNYLDPLGEGDKVTAADINVAVSDISSSINDLVNKGARQFLIFNLPAMGVLPWATANDTANDKSFSQNATKVSIEHNHSLNETLENLDKDFILKNMNVTLMLMDAYAFVEDVINDVLVNSSKSNYAGSQSHHITNITERCYTGDYYGKDGSACLSPNEYIFWDHVHPTTVIHEMIAQSVKDLLVDDYGYQINKMMGKLSVDEIQALDRFNRIMNHL